MNYVLISIFTVTLANYKKSDGQYHTRSPQLTRGPCVLLNVESAKGPPLPKIKCISSTKNILINPKSLEESIFLQYSIHIVEAGSGDTETSLSHRLRLCSLQCVFSPSLPPPPASCTSWLQLPESGSV